MIVYLCGCCGYPLTENGDFLSNLKDLADIRAYLKKHKNATVKRLNGNCCPDLRDDYIEHRKEI